MNKPKTVAISRREFARRAAFASAAASFAPSGILAEPQAPSSTPPPPQTSAPSTPQLTPEGQIESDGRFNTIAALYPTRFSYEQKSDLLRLSNALQPVLDRLRKFPAENADGPALYLKPLLEREKKPSPFMPAPGSAAPAASPKKR